MSHQNNEKLKRVDLKNSAQSIQVFSLRTRVFHTLFVILFLVILFIVKTYDDTSDIYPFHMILGLILAFITLYRLCWGFSGFVFQPRLLWQYGLQILNPKAKRFANHNPASSWGSLFMFITSIGLAITGIVKSQAHFQALAEELYLEEVHEWLTEAFWILAAIHVAGVLLHMLVHRDNVALSMITGKKSGLQTEDLDFARPSDKKSAMVFLGMTLVFTLYVLANYDARTRRMNFFGQHLQLSDPPTQGKQ